MSESWCVLVGVDFSPSSRRALELATALSLRAEAPLELLHVWNPNYVAAPGPLAPALAAWIAERKERLAEQLEEWASEARRAGVRATCRIAEGVASRTIPDVARAAGAGLVVVGRRGFANLAHVLLGSVSERVAHLAPCPVLIVPETTSPVRSPERLLVGIDFSQAARDAYQAARELAEELEAPGGLLLVHVRPAAAELALEAGAELAAEPSLEQVYRGEYPFDQAALERWARQSEPSRIRVPLAARVVEGNAPRTLVSEARAQACDWLVVGLQGRSSLAALLTGSTTDRVLKLADRPVLVVPASAPTPGEFTG